MPTSFGTATVNGGGTIGVLDPNTNIVYGQPLGVSHLALVPATIDPTGGDEVTADIQAFIDLQPDGSRIRFQPGGRYWCDLTLTLAGRKRLLIDLNGSTVFSKSKLPLIYHYTNMGITAPGDTGPYTIPGWDPAAQAIYVDPASSQNLSSRNNDQVGDDTNVAPGQDNVPILTFCRSPIKSTGYRLAQILSKANIACTPGTGLAILFLGPNSALARFSLITDGAGNRCQNIKIGNGTLAGTNTTGIYDTTVEGQHGITALGVNGLELGPNLLIRNVWGDGVNATVDNPAGSGTHLGVAPGGNACRNVYFHDVEIHHNGRQGITATGILNGLIERCYLHDNPRSGLDTEIPTNSCVINLTVRWNTIRPHFSWVNPAAYPVGSNIYFENLTLDGNITSGLNFNANNTLAAPAPKLRWKNFTVINNTDDSTSPYNNPGHYDLQFLNVDVVTVTGNSAVLQGGSPVMFFVHHASCTQVAVHDDTITGSTPWVTGHAYAFGNTVYDGISMCWWCTQAHTSSPTTRPPTGSNFDPFWNRVEVSGTVLPVGFADVEGGGQVAATGQVSTGRSGSASVLGGGEVDAVGHSVAHGFAIVQGGGFVVAVGQQKSVANVRGGGMVTATGTIGNAEQDTGEWLTGDVALRGPGWNEGPWNETPWNGFDA